MPSPETSAAGATPSARPWLPALQILWILIVCAIAMLASSRSLFSLSIYSVILQPYPSPLNMMLAMELCLLVAPVALFLEGRQRQWVVLLGSLGMGLLLAGWPAVGFLGGWVAALFPLPFLPLARKVRLGLLVAVLSGLLIWLMTPGRDGLHLRWYGYYFFMICAFRYVLFFYESMGPGPRRPLADIFLDYLVYLLSGPSFMVLPYQIVIPAFSAFRAGASRKSAEEHLARASTLMTWALVNGGLAYVMAHHRSMLKGLPALASHLYLFTNAILAVSSTSHFLIGLLALWGFDVPEPFRFVFLARSLSEFLSRFAAHFTNFLATVFYYPLLVALRKRGPVLSRALALGLTLMVGNTFVHLFRYAYLIGQDGSAIVRIKLIFYGNAFLALAILGWLALARICSPLPRKWPILAKPPAALFLRVLSFCSIYVIFTYDWFI